MRGVDREQGCIVVVRPDQYVGVPPGRFDALRVLMFMIDAGAIRHARKFLQRVALSHSEESRRTC
jgi:hypothetical protein